MNLAKENLTALGQFIAALIGFIGIGLAMYLAFVDNGKWGAVLFIALCALVVGNFHNISKLSISLSQLTFELVHSVKEARSLMPVLRKHALANARALIALAYTGNDSILLESASNPDEMREAVLQEALKILSAVNATTEEKEEILALAISHYRSEWLTYVSTRVNSRHMNEQEKLQKIGTMSISESSPQEIERAFAAAGLLDSNLLALIEDLDFWLKNHRHRRADIWAQRENWAYIDSLS